MIKQSFAFNSLNISTSFNQYHVAAVGYFGNHYHLIMKKKRLNCDGKTFYQYQQNKPSSLT